MRSTCFLFALVGLVACNGSLTDAEQDASLPDVSRPDVVAETDSGGTDVPNAPDVSEPLDVGTDVPDTGPPPEYTDVPDRDIDVDRTTEERRTFEYAISDLDPAAVSTPGEYFSTNQAVGIIDTRVQPRGELMVWFGTGGGQRSQLELMASYGYHVIQVPYANGWFSRVCSGDAFTPECRGNMRLEALTGMDLPTPDRDGNEVRISRADSAESRIPFILRALMEDDPTSDWGYFLKSETDLFWESVAVSGGSHGASTSTRFAVHRRVARAVPIVGPRDQDSNWQSMAPATPAYRIFAFSHDQDGLWDNPDYPRHYDRSWDLLGLDDYGPLTWVEDEPFPWSLSRQLLTRRPMDNPHGCCGANGPREDGELVFAEVLRYVYTHPVADYVEL